MLSHDILSWAEHAANSVLADLGNRWLHVQHVVSLAKKVAPILDDVERDYLLAAAYVHDIGYAPDLVETGFHPLDGARYILQNADLRLASLVAHHTGARFTARLLHVEKELRRFPREQSALSDALNYCDALSGPGGQQVTLRERYDDILHRYGPDDPVFLSFERAYPSLRMDIVRTERRLRLLDHRQKKEARFLPQ